MSDQITNEVRVTLLTRVFRALFPKRAPQLRYFWIGETSEVYVAYSLQQALDAFAQPEDLEELEYGELSDDEVHCERYMRNDETGEFVHTSLAKEGSECRVIPNIVMTAYA